MAVFEGLAKRLRGVDVFTKTVEGFTVRTRAGGLVSLVAYIVMAILFVSELSSYLSYKQHTKFVVDGTRNEQMSIYLDIHFPRLSCNLIGIDAMDNFGNGQVELSNDVFKVRTDPSGAVIPDVKMTKAHRLQHTTAQNDSALPNDYCGSCYGAKVGCCNTCEEVKDAYHERNWMLVDLENIEQCVRDGLAQDNKLVENEGCVVKGKIDVARMAGTFQIAPGHSFMFRGSNLHDMSVFKANDKLDLSHQINSLSFGEPFPGQKNPLDGATKTARSDDIGMHEYFVKVVPTTYVHGDGTTVSSNQYSVAERFRPVNLEREKSWLPGVHIFYELSPIKVEVQETRRSFLHFLVQLCAIIGGVFTVMSMIDALVYHGGRFVRRKIQIGKAD